MSPHHSWAWASWSNGHLPLQRAGGHRRFLSEAAHRNGLTVRLGGPWAWKFPAAPAVGEGIAPGPAHTHRIPRPVLTPRQGSGQAPLWGVLAAALRPAVGGGVLCRPSGGFPRFLLPSPAAVHASQPFCPACPQCPGAGGQRRKGDFLFLLTLRATRLKLGLGGVLRLGGNSVVSEAVLWLSRGKLGVSETMAQWGREAANPLTWLN